MTCLGPSVPNHIFMYLCRQYSSLKNEIRSQNVTEEHVLGWLVRTKKVGNSASIMARPRPVVYARPTVDPQETDSGSKMRRSNCVSFLRLVPVTDVLLSLGIVICIPGGFQTRLVCRTTCPSASFWPLPRPVRRLTSTLRILRQTWLHMLLPGLS